MIKYFIGFAAALIIIRKRLHGPVLVCQHEKSYDEREMDFMLHLIAIMNGTIQDK